MSKNMLHALGYVALAFTIVIGAAYAAATIDAALHLRYDPIGAGPSWTEMQKMLAASN